MKAADAVICMVEQGPDKAMNLYNTRKQKQVKKDVDTDSAPEGV